MLRHKAVKIVPSTFARHEEKIEPGLDPDLSSSTALRWLDPFTYLFVPQFSHLYTKDDSVYLTSQDICDCL